MAITSDTLLERLYLKRQLTFWRLIAICGAIFFLVMYIERKENISPVTGDFVARVLIEGVITDDHYLHKVLKEIEENDHAKALVIWLDTPGGTAVGGEELHYRLKSIASHKPVVAVMRNICASAGYMTAVGADHIVAREGTITGSIGVIIQTAEFTELASKLGVNPIIVKSGPFKAAPSPVEKFSPEQREVIEDMVQDFYGVFVDMVADSRDMPRNRVLELADGRVYSGRQALGLGLVDAIGGEEEALAWLYEEKKIEDSLEIRDMKIKAPQEGFMQKLFGYAGISLPARARLPLDGMLLIWQPAEL